MTLAQWIAKNGGQHLSHHTTAWLAQQRQCSVRSLMLLDLATLASTPLAGEVCRREIARQCREGHIASPFHR